MKYLYNLFVGLYYRALKLASAWNPKAAEWIRGRQNVFTELRNNLGSTNRLIWVHCSSAGEFEQGKPVIEALKKEYPGYKVLVSFFSPSGYAVAKNYAAADTICYLPHDTAANARRFMDLVNPSLVIFIKYEFWYHHLAEAARRNIPVLLVAGVFRPDAIFFKPYGGFYRDLLHFFRHLFVQDEGSLQRLRAAGIRHGSIGGDTRFDRVARIAAEAGQVPGISEFIKDAPVLVAGSTWPGDEELLAYHGEAKLILAPHEINESHLQSIQKRFPGAVRYSALTPGTDARVLIIDNVGMLSRLYQYADVCYVGGGFTRDGIHNILEAAVWAKPVLFGPEYKKYREATELIAAGGALSVKNAGEWKTAAQQLFADGHERRAMGERSARYVKENSGGTEAVLRYIQENRLLTR